MSQSANIVSLHPYFKARPGKLAEAKAMLPKFVAKTATEKLVLQYDFTVNGDEIFCRESYLGAEGFLFHAENIATLLADLLTLADLTRVEVHGPAAELEKLKGPLAGLNPAWFVYECGVVR
jgi:quinol monooxygenase YgiN